ILEEMIDWHLKGTRYGIGMDPDDHLLHAGENGVQLTWMDAKVGEWVVTPRMGKPVEINALWYNALTIMTDFAIRLGRSGQPYRDIAIAVGGSFKRFLRKDGHGLYDLLDGPTGDDAAIRPNQILAVSLPHSPLDGAACRSVVEVCGHELLCSYGLRSLSPRDKSYRGHYRGGVADRDGAYHQGTVWAWLLGHYALAEYRVKGDAEAAQKRLEPLADHLLDAGLGSISEIFDGDPPHRATGAPAQAWSVACTLDAWWRLEQAKRL
ncbi:MAG: amylo-alpha-1,6-glucosidase, partial [Candidatus Thiodiazotropha endolucinida]